MIERGKRKKLYGVCKFVNELKMVFMCFFYCERVLFERKSIDWWVGKKTRKNVSSSNLSAVCWCFCGLRFYALAN